MTDIDINPSSMGPIFGVWIGRPYGFRNGPSAIGPQLFDSSAVVWYAMCLDVLNWALWVWFDDRYWYQSFIDGSNIWGVDRIDPWGPEIDIPPLGPQLFGSSGVVGYVMRLDSLYWALWVRYHDRYWYQCFIDGTIYGVWIGPTLGVPKRAICHWAAAIW